MGGDPRVAWGGCPFMPQVQKQLHAKRAPAIDPVAKIERSGGGETSIPMPFVVPPSLRSDF